MPDKKISELDSAGALDGTESVPCVKGGATVKTTPDALVAAALGFQSVRLSADSTKAADDTIALDPTLRFTLPVGTHEIIGALGFFYGAGGITARFGGSAVVSLLLSRTFSINEDGQAHLKTFISGGELIFDEPGGSSAEGNGFISVVVVVTAAGTFGIEWAQQNSDPSDSSIVQGSWLARKKVTS